MEDVAKYADKSADPFYHLTHTKAQVEETDSHYIVRADVPEHEKDNVKILVKDDKVIVNGQRRFEDRVKDENSQIATNSYQTYREIIPLEHPVREKHIHQSWKDGVLTLRIPKA
jgi:HSP20 family molecular chaperone IbpA